MTPRETKAAKVAQTLIATHGDPHLVPDGMWGPESQKAYSYADILTRQAVDSVAASFGTSVSGLYTAYQATLVDQVRRRKATISSHQEILANQAAMKKIVTKVAAEEGVPAETALRICWLESKFDPNAISATHAKGLFQFTSIAVADVRDRAGYDLSGNEFDAEGNARAGMKYIKLVAKDLGLPLSDAAGVYMGFNIGPSAARAYMRGQVTPSVARLISLQAYGPPSVYGRNLRAAVERVLV